MQLNRKKDSVIKQKFINHFYQTIHLLALLLNIQLFNHFYVQLDAKLK